MTSLIFSTKESFRLIEPAQTKGWPLNLQKEFSNLLATALEPALQPTYHQNSCHSNKSIIFGQGGKLSSRRFHLLRNQDVSGVSGIGFVAEGVMFSSGKAVLNWLNGVQSVGVYDSLDDLISVHGHNGATVIQWEDYTPAEKGTYLTQYS